MNIINNYLLLNRAVLSLARRVISVSVGNTPPVSTAHISTVPSFSITSYVPLSNDSTPAIQ